MKAQASSFALPARRELLGFLFAFVCVFAGLSLPSPGIGPWYVRAHVAAARVFLPSDPLASGVTLALFPPSKELTATPWQATLLVEPASGGPISVPIDLRLLMFLPTAAFVALGAATPLGGWKRNAKLLAIGLPLLELLLLCLVLTPLLSFLGGTGPIKAFELSRLSHTCLQIVYRALVAPPGMTFALPLFLWWLLLRKLGGVQSSENRTSGSEFRRV